MSLAIVAMTGTMWSTDRGEPRQLARHKRPLQSAAYRPDDSQVFEPLPEDTSPIEAMQVAVARNEPPLPEELEGPAPIPEQPSNEGIISEDYPSSYESSSAGGAERMPAGLTVES